MNTLHGQCVPGAAQYVLGYKFSGPQLEGRMTCPSSVSASDRNVTDVALCIEIGSFPHCLFSYIQNRGHKNSSFGGCLSSKALPFSSP